MYSRRESQGNLLCSEPQADLLTRFLSSRPFELPSPHVPSKLLLEGEGTPRAARLDLLGPQPQQQQIGHEGYCHRAFHPCRVLGDLMLPQPYYALQFFDTELSGEGLARCLE
jgi:hypothetical protein